MQNESSTATTFTLKDGSTVKYRYLAQNQGDSLGRVYDDEWEWRLTEATALILNLSGANSSRLLAGILDGGGLVMAGIYSVRDSIIGVQSALGGQGSAIVSLK